MKRFVLTAVTAALLAACGGGSDKKNPPVVDPIDETPLSEAPVVDDPDVTVPDVTVPDAVFEPEVKALSGMTLTDAEGNPLANASVTLSSLATAQYSAFSLGSSLTTDADGRIILNNLAPGSYLVNIVIGDTTVSLTLIIGEGNALEDIEVTAPVLVADGEDGVVVTDLTEEGVFISVAGTVYSDEGPVAGAQISVNGGAFSNGAMAQALADENGNFRLAMTLTAERLIALENGEVVIFAEGFERLSIPVTSEINLAVAASAVTGLNFKLEPLATPVGIYYSETFDLAGAGVCGDWTEVTPEEDAECSDCSVPGGPVEGPVFAAAAVAEVSDVDDTLWNLHSQGAGLVNQAFTDGNVLMAPDDSTAGAVPDPMTQGACWYGGSVDGMAETGNFLGEKEVSESDEVLDGGTSITDNSGSIVSPMIDLTGVVAPVSISFDTWWEIESVNPNENGYDIMALEVSTDSGVTWFTLAKLNPYSDPVESGVERDPIPFSNRGYNKAPAWLHQEAISLDEFAGSQIQLRFTFRTQDELYNGFRGWMIDNVRITDQMGTFPVNRDRIAWEVEWNFPEEMVVGGEYEAAVATYVDAADVAQLILVENPDTADEQVVDTAVVDESDEYAILFTPDTSEPGLTLYALKAVDAEGTVVGFRIWGVFVAEEPADFTVSSDLSPNPNVSLNDGSTYNFTADLSWAGGDVSVGSARLVVDTGIDTSSDEVTELTERSVTLSAAAQVSGDNTVYVTVILLDEGGNEVYSEVITYLVLYL